MKQNRHSVLIAVFRRFAVLAALSLTCSRLLAAQGISTVTSAQTPGVAPVCDPSILGSPYIPVDSWIYPEMWRLYALGYVDSVYLGIRPWTRAGVAHMLEEAGSRLEGADTSRNSAADQAQGIYEDIGAQLRRDEEGPCGPRRGGARIESVYSAARGISGTPLFDSYHLGSTVINDYGRPYANGFNGFSGLSGYATAGRFTFYIRTEGQFAPSAAGYSTGLAQELSTIDGLPYVNPTTGLPYRFATLPQGPVSVASQGRFLEAYISYQFLNHLISFGKQDQWLSPDQGGSFAYSNNAQNIYAFEINRIEPLYIPLLSKITGPFRYEFLLGALQGHTLVANPAYPGPNQANVIAPGNPWVHLEKINFKPTQNVEFGFERTAIWGGEGHSPVTIGNFLRSFFSLSGTNEATKFGRQDPGARFGSFDFCYRLPFVRKWLTFYTDAEVHDDVSPIDAPRRASWAPGLYLSHVPGIPGLDVRAEAGMTDPGVRTSNGGHFMYYETIERQGYTNQGQIFGHWIGREDKGGQAWLTYHLGGNEWIQLGLRNQKAAKDFIPGGTTLNEVNLQVVKRLNRDIELKGNFSFEAWKAPTYLLGTQKVTATSFQLTWYPERKVSF